MKRSRRTLQEIISDSILGRTKLRGKITVANLLITLAVVLIMGIYIYLRIQAASQQLINSVETNAQIKAEDDLYTTTREQAVLLDSFFESMSRNTVIAGASIESILSNQELSSSTYWDANTALTQLPSGSWDNANEEIPSIFIPTGVNFSPVFTSKLNRLKHSELIFPSILEGNPDIVAIYFGGSTKETYYYPNIDLANIVPADFDVTGRQWYISAKPENNPNKLVIWSAPYEDAALNGLVITASTPVYDDNQRFQGVTAMDIQITRLIKLVSSAKIGETGYAFLLDNSNRVISLPPTGAIDFGITDENALLSEIIDPSALSSATPEFYDLLEKVSQEPEGIFTLTIGNKEKKIAFYTIAQVNYKLVSILPAEEIFADKTAISEQIQGETRATIFFSILLVVAVFAFAALITFRVSNNLTEPLSTLNNAATEIIHGNFNTRIQLNSGDELETLSSTLNTMTDTIKDLVSSLEGRVSERTKKLEQVILEGERSRSQYEAIAKVARAITTQKSLTELLPEITRVISEQFNFYHVGIFLNDPTNSYAVLAAANSEGGRRMLNRRHQLRIGAQGIVGYATSTKKARIALSVGKDAVFFNNPDLPDTQSEVALPLLEADTVVGALDVQSTEPNAFTDKDLEALNILAELVGIAIQNARLYEKMDRSLAEAEAASRQYFRENWNRLTNEYKVAGYSYTARGAQIITNTEEKEKIANQKEVVVPISIRGEEIGELSISIPEAEKIKADQMDLIRAVADRVAVIAENARLFDETTRRAERERLVTDITTKIRTTNDPQTMIETAVNELREALKISRIEIVSKKKKLPD